MIRMFYACICCDAAGEVNNIENLDGWCPNCNAHNGEVSYYSHMTSEEFIEELSKLTEREISKYAKAIKICAEDICEYKL